VAGEHRRALRLRRVRREHRLDPNLGQRPCDLRPGKSELLQAFQRVSPVARIMRQSHLALDCPPPLRRGVFLREIQQLHRDRDRLRHLGSAGLLGLLLGLLGAAGVRVGELLARLGRAGLARRALSLLVGLYMAWFVAPPDYQ